MTWSTPWLWLWLLALPLAAQPFHVEATPARKVRVVLSETQTTPNMQAQQWGVFAACPPSNEAQQLLSARLVAAGRVGRREVEKSRLRQTVLFVSYPGRGSSQMEARATYELQLNSRQLVPGAVPVRPLRAAERAAYLADDDPLDRDWLQAHALLRTRGESDLELARRCYLEMADTFQYRWVVGADTRASALCARGWGHCGTLAKAFCAAMRANGVPARTLVGRWAKSSGPPEDRFRDQDHVKAEFFAAGTGWVPVDLSSAIVHGDPEGNFGRDRGDFLVLHYDSVWLDRPRGLQSFQCPWSYGSYSGNWEGWSESREILVEEI